MITTDTVKSLKLWSIWIEPQKFLLSFGGNSCFILIKQSSWRRCRLFSCDRPSSTKIPREILNYCLSGLTRAVLTMRADDSGASPTAMCRCIFLNLMCLRYHSRFYHSSGRQQNSMYQLSLLIFSVLRILLQPGHTQMNFIYYLYQFLEHFKYPYNVFWV